MQAGQSIYVPAVRGESRAGGRGQVAKLIGLRARQLRARGGCRRQVLYHFPSTLGGKYSPSPSGGFKVNGVAQDPSWHYQPGILVGVPDNEPEAIIPAGPNVAVGTVWIDLSEPHYGIHGTSEPQTIGYAASNGCVRLTNWDVEFLSHHVKAGVPVEFRDISGQKQAEDPANATAAGASVHRRARGRGHPRGVGERALAVRRRYDRAPERDLERDFRRHLDRRGAVDCTDSVSRTRTEPAQPKQTQPKQEETPKAAEPPRVDEHAGHTPGR